MRSCFVPGTVYENVKGLKGVWWIAYIAEHEGQHLTKLIDVRFEGVVSDVGHVVLRLSYAVDFRKFEYARAPSNGVSLALEPDRFAQVHIEILRWCVEAIVHRAKKLDLWTHDGAIPHRIHAFRPEVRRVDDNVSVMDVSNTSV